MADKFLLISSILSCLCLTPGLADTSCCDPGYFKECPKNVTVLEGRSATLNCFSHEEIQKCSWYSSIHSKNITIDGRESSFWKGSPSPKDCSLTIPEVSKWDRGRWKCIVKIRGRDHISNSAWIKVAQPFTAVSLRSKENFNSKQSVLSVEEGQAQSIDCSVRAASPQPVASLYTESLSGGKIDVMSKTMEPMSSRTFWNDTGFSPSPYSSTFRTNFSHQEHKHNLTCHVYYPEAPDISRNVTSTLIVKIPPKFLQNQRKLSLSNDDLLKIQFKSNPVPTEVQVRTLKKGNVWTKAVTIHDIDCEEEDCRFEIPADELNLKNQDTSMVVITAREVQEVIYVEYRDTQAASYIGIAVSFFVVFLVILFMVWRRRKEKAKRNKLKDENHDQEIPLTTEDKNKEEENEDKGNEDKIDEVSVT